MAEKTTKKSAKKAVEVPTLENLVASLSEKKQDLVELKRSNLAGELVNPRAITHLRKEIARLSTSIHELELGEAVKESN